ncbi:MAG: hypothetical protein A3E09_01465 [Candidatus Liptonbacteria bacterium RIFCSPHIGHO2_12_FULL_60_13]|uniref:Uncharacterized protein n=1 Tax=Candidatus Liptonbacteria bacterium RIFCSPHIGHO2_12_FULL_60_13 TaxID=1798648 RepID=A0A1G2CER4_9BACT|nr:MAG: hypothetical protein A3E09_01465 [Candidatus Liptonbacteria bacterium RIFCSPHIGHO2_12_FULL_60_13]
MAFGALLFGMIAVQCIAYLFFQQQAGVVSHKKYIIYNACFMVGQAAQIIDSALMGAWASLSVAAFFFAATAFGAFRRYLLLRNPQ